MKMSLLLRVLLCFVLWFYFLFFFPFYSGCFPLHYYKGKYSAKDLRGLCFVFNMVNLVIGQITENFSFQNWGNSLFLGFRCQLWKIKNYQLLNRNGTCRGKKNGHSMWYHWAIIAVENPLSWVTMRSKPSIPQLWLYKKALQLSYNRWVQSLVRAPQFSSTQLFQQAHSHLLETHARCWFIGKMFSPSHCSEQLGFACSGLLFYLEVLTSFKLARPSNTKEIERKEW